MAPQDWTTPQSNALWRDASKTLFDPCPHGWRVPRSGTGDLNPWRSFGSADNQYANGSWITAEPGFTGARWSVPALTSGTAWCPASGYRVCDPGHLKKPSTDGYEWSSTVIGGTQAITIGYNSGSVRLVIRDSRATGTSVRCIRE